MHLPTTAAYLRTLLTVTCARLSLSLSLSLSLCCRYDILGRSMLDKASTMVYPDDHARFSAAFAEAIERFTAAEQSTPR